MNDGKSPTWFAYALSIQEQFPQINYIVKTDSDAMPLLDKFFDLTQNGVLPPVPHNQDIVAGLPVDKFWWGNLRSRDKQTGKERYFKRKYGGYIHFYMQGQWYLFSPDIVKVIVSEAEDASSYEEFHEDHDVTSMAYHSERPIRNVFIDLKNMPTFHGVKTRNRRRFNKIWSAELKRYADLVNRTGIVATA